NTSAVTAPAWRRGGVADVSRLSREELGAAARELQERLAWVRDYLDPDGVQHRLDELSEELSQPRFWDDAKRAAAVSSAPARLTRKLDTSRAISSEIEDLPALLELVDEDDSLAEEASDTVNRIRAVIERLEEEALFTGEYDSGNAIATLSAGAGGTDAQDWT